MSKPLASVIIDNYNYARFLAEAIESALAQTYTPVEVMVVDDGSTDGSREVMARYADRTIPILKENGGQASAFNAGFAASQGDCVMFLDADDVLMPRALEHAAPLLSGDGVAKVHWQLQKVDHESRKIQGLVPHYEPAEGNLAELVVEAGPAGAAFPGVWPPTSGNLWPRWFLNRVMPVPEDEYRIAADNYLLELTPLFGKIARLKRPHGLYRIHGGNAGASLPFDDQLMLWKQFSELACRHLAQHTQVPEDQWLVRCRAHSWFHRCDRVLSDLRSVVPAESTALFVDQDHLGIGSEIRGIRRIPFPNRRGVYWGKPADDETAVTELESELRRGAEFIAVFWPARWWLEYYRVFGESLNALPRLTETDDLIVFDARPLTHDP